MPHAPAELGEAAGSRSAHSHETDVMLITRDKLSYLIINHVESLNQNKATAARHKRLASYPPKDRQTQ